MVVASSRWLVMVTLVESVEHSVEWIEPTPAEMVQEILGEEFCMRDGFRRRASLVSVKNWPRNVRGGGVLPAGEGEAGSLSWGMQALQLAWPRA